MAAINTIFFDWGGVIADDPGDDFLKQLLLDIGASHDQAQEIFDSYIRQFLRGELSEKEYWEMLRSHYGLAVHESISEEFIRWRGLSANDHVFGLVDEAKAKGLRTALLTNVIEPTYNVLQKAGHYDRFDNVIASCKVGFAKPEIEIYTLALEMMDTTAAHSVFIDDKQKNLVPARELGFTTILAENPAQIIRDVQQYI
jgi:epoxide hydrolase-like predicted phosphatase